jgi:hypothetical protein
MLFRLYGLRPTPSVIYNAIPWSWLIDWFSNAGDIIENLEVGVADRLAADYMYMMRENWGHVERFSTARIYRENGIIADITSTSQRLLSVKTRVLGDPFGFNTSANNLTGMQLSILGALGLSRLR